VGLGPKVDFEKKVLPSIFSLCYPLTGDIGRPGCMALAAEVEVKSVQNTFFIEGEERQK
jgi:uncharacterized membrane protein